MWPRIPARPSVRGHFAFTLRLASIHAGISIRRLAERAGRSRCELGNRGRYRSIALWGSDKVAVATLPTVERGGKICHRPEWVKIEFRR